MPRTLPWLVKDKEKETAKTPRKPRERSSSPAELVNSDLDDLDAPSTLVTPKRKSRQHVDRSPSTSPAPAPPTVERMREGLNADDVWLMVEDEFDATARLYTQHIHHAEYMRLKRLHRSRGAETLAQLGHGTDGKTEQSRAVKMQIEAKENARKRKSADAEEDDDSDDEYMVDPNLASLMTGSQRHPSSSKAPAGLVKAKSNTRAAAGYLQSPRKGTKTRDVFAGSQRSGMSRIASIAEDDETDDDDLDGPVPKTALSTAYRNVDPALDKPRLSIEKTRDKPPNEGLFKQFARKPREEPESQPSVKREPEPEPRGTSSIVNDSKSKDAYTSRSSQKSTVAEILARRRGKTQQPEPSGVSRSEVRIKNEPLSPPTSRSSTLLSQATTASQKSGASDILARRKTDPVKIKDEKPRAKAQLDDIPTFLF